MVTLDILHLFLSMGQKLFPCSQHDKRPLTPHGFKDASDNPDQIAKWYSQFPGCAWGTPTSAEYGVVDVDPKNGGDATWASLIREHGELPPCPTVITGSGGRHFVMRFPLGTRSDNTGKIGKGIDVRAEGGYVIIPPSRIHEPHHFQPYSWEQGKGLSRLPIHDAPVWLATAASTPSRSQQRETQTAKVTTVSVVGDTGDLQTHPGSSQGGRRTTFLRLAGAELGSRQHSVEQVREWAKEWAKRCEPAFTEWEKHWQCLIRKEAEKPNNKPSLSAVSVLVPPTTELDKQPTNALRPTANPELVDCLNAVGAAANTNTETGGRETGSVTAGTDCSAEPISLHPDAYHGIFGDMTNAVAPQTEGHPAGTLVSLLTLAGNFIGTGAWVRVGPRKHHPTLYTAITACTSGGKGDAYAVGRYVFGKVDLDYCVNAIAQGVGSGEGLIERVRDELATVGKKGEPITVPGSTEKRCLLRLPELSRAFRVGRRESSTLSEVLREAWDGDPINVPNRGSNALVASGYSIGVLGDITPGALSKLLSTGTEAFDGYANRFLWCSVVSQRDLPSGGNIAVLDVFIERLKAVLNKAKNAGEVVRDAEAERLWASVYPSLKASGDSVPHTDRARPYVVRLSLLYALGDGEKVIRVPHLKAALAVWEWCRRSASALFGSSLSATPNPEPDPLWLSLLNAITASPGVSRSELVIAFRRRGNAEAISQTLETLKAKGMAHARYTQSPNGGPKRESWYPSSEPEKPNNMSSSTPTTDLVPTVSVPVVGTQTTNCTTANPFTGLVVGDIGEPTTQKEVSCLSDPADTDSEERNSEEVVQEFPAEAAFDKSVAADDRSQTAHITMLELTADGVVYSHQISEPPDAEWVSELWHFPKTRSPRTPQADKAIQDAILRSDLRWENEHVVGYGLTPGEADWIRCNPKKAELVAKRKSGKTT